ncbi:MAG: hypothetical protein SFV18_18935 [Bryobacteraceae bacterium]|nr:hypothetical protein [Bryobacteraceae bacterium]
MKLGAEPKKVAILGGLLAVAAVVFYMNVLAPGGESVDMPNLPAPKAGTPAGAAPERKAAVRPRTEFRPSLKRSPDDPLDPARVDPTLRLDILAKLQNVSMTGSGRNLFEFAAAPPPPAPKVEPSKTPAPKIFVGPMPPPVETAKTEVTPPKPVAPPIPLKFYGFISTPRGTAKRGFFLDGEDIVVASEGDTIKKRYKVVRIGLTNVEMEDTQFSQRQTLRLEEQPNS